MLSRKILANLEFAISIKLRSTLENYTFQIANTDKDFSYDTDCIKAFSFPYHRSSVKPDPSITKLSPLLFKASQGFFAFR
jgi:hypothetical protein